ncbi:unnamed protein product, partial [marine sediment metagenome]
SFILNLKFVLINKPEIQCVKVIVNIGLVIRANSCSLLKQGRSNKQKINLLGWVKFYGSSQGVFNLPPTMKILV